MKLHYYPETDSLYIDLSEQQSVDSLEVSDNLVVDLDAAGRVVGLDIQHASEWMSIDNLETIELPARTLRMG